MQKLFNAMSVASFVMSGAMVAGIVVLYSNIPSITKHYMSQLQEELGKMVTDKLPVQLDKTMPKLPTSTGPAVPIKSPF
tara:strand:- start:467 stop:703 length:237 start_codon:yes stop_codon:yes gene_type:complete